MGNPGIGNVAVKPEDKLTDPVAKAFVSECLPAIVERFEPELVTSAKLPSGVIATSAGSGKHMPGSSRST